MVDDSEDIELVSIYGPGNSFARMETELWLYGQLKIRTWEVCRRVWGMCVSTQLKNYRME